MRLWIVALFVGLVGAANRGLPDEIKAEIKAWKEAGHSPELQFLDDKGKAVRASVHTAMTRFGFWGFGNSDEDVKFHVFTDRAANVTGVELPLPLSKADLLAAGWDSCRNTKIVVHGFSNSVASNMVQSIKNAYLRSGSLNVVALDWSALCPAPLYINARLNVDFAGERLGALLTLLVNESLATHSQLHIIGHSLGAHVSGQGACHLREATGDRPARITGLDPALPLFMKSDPSVRLSEDDADEVDVIHTCAGELGFSTAVGTSDFYPNGGRIQPGCGADITGSCAHSRAYEYFATSIGEGTGFRATHCDDYKDALAQNCPGSEPDGCMGDKFHFVEDGAYYLQTGDEEPIVRC